MKMNKPKYKNTKVQVDGIMFDSKKEAERYAELLILQRAGSIVDLKIHPKFTLLEKFTDMDGIKERAITYSPDFTYHDEEACRWVAEDVKAFDKKTQKFLITESTKIKIKLFKGIYSHYKFLLV